MQTCSSPWDRLAVGVRVSLSSVCDPQGTPQLSHARLFKFYSTVSSPLTGQPPMGPKNALACTFTEINAILCSHVRAVLQQ